MSLKLVFAACAHAATCACCVPAAAAAARAYAPRAAGPPSPSPTPGTAALRADAGLDALLSNFWSNSQGYLTYCPSASSDADRNGDVVCSEPAATSWRAASAHKLKTPAAPPKPSGYWNYQEAIHAAALGAAVHPLNNYTDWVRKMVEAQFVHGSGWNVSYYDDMNWAVLALLAAHEHILAPHNTGYLQQAQTWFLKRVLHTMS